MRGRRALRTLFAGWLLLAVVLSMPDRSTVHAAVSDYGVYVQDEAQVMSSTAKDTLYKQAVWLHDRTGSAQVSVVTVPLSKLEGHTLEEYAVDRFRSMQLGSKERNDGVLLLYAQGGSPHLRIEVGYGLEGQITDGKAGAILDQYFIPSEAASDLDQAFVQTQTALIREAALEYGLGDESLPDGAGNLAPLDDGTSSAGWWGALPLFAKAAIAGFIVLLFVLDFKFTGGAITFGILSMLGRGGRGGGGGGGFGGGRGGGGSSGGGGASR